MYLKFKNKKDKNLQYNRRETKTRYLNNCLFDVVVVGFFFCIIIIIVIVVGNNNNYIYI